MPQSVSASGILGVTIPVKGRRSCTRLSAVCVSHEFASAGGRHDGIDDDVFRFIFPQTVRDGTDDVRIGQHTDLDRVRADIPEDTVQLEGYKLRGNL